ncbi:hypothetical protein DITRI_Ditri20bG0085000 [Diplodiscus trichospermus]
MEETEAEASMVNNPEQFSFGGEVAHCYCGRAAKLFVSRTSKNPGRKFWGCSYHENNCDFFKWHDEWVNERTLMVLKEIRRLNANLERFDAQIDGEMVRLNSVIIKQSETLTSMKSSRDWYKIGFYTVVGMLACRIVFRFV